MSPTDQRPDSAKDSPRTDEKSTPDGDFLRGATVTDTGRRDSDGDDPIVVPDGGQAADGADTPDEPATTAGDDDADGEGSPLRSTLSRWVHVGLVGILLLVTLVATFQFYFAASGAVNELVADRYRQIFQATFNLAVIMAAVAGLSYLGWRRR